LRRRPVVFNYKKVALKLLHSIYLKFSANSCIVHKRIISPWETTMRFPLAVAACFGLALISTAVADTASGGRLLVFERQGAPSAAEAAGGVRVLRGSATAPRAASDSYDTSALGPGRWQAVAGERFWMFDRQTNKLASCRNIGTPNVGEREIECVFGTFGRYRRTFGDNFRH
jgi:hypothetical protein